MKNGFTRREVLAGLLGVPAALAACKTAQQTGVPPGEIVGVSNQIGHRIRDGLTVEVPADRWQQVPVVIVGGGVAGLSAAWQFLSSGFEDFILIELEASPGGTSRSGASSTVAYPWGAHYLPAPTKENVELIRLLDEMGLVEGEDEFGEPAIAEQYLCRDPEERVFFKGRWYEGLYLQAGASQDDIAQLDSFNNEVNRWVGWRDSKHRRAFAIPISFASDDPEVTFLDKLTMGEWLEQKGYTSPRLRWLVDYACRDDYGMTASNVSAWAGLFYFASRVSTPGEEPRPLITWPEGNGRLVAHLYRKAESKVRLGLAVCDIVPADSKGKAGIDVIAVDHTERASLGVHAEQVVFAAPHFISKYLIRPYRDRSPAHVSAFEYGSWMVANLALSGRPRSLGFPLAWDNVLYESPSLGYVVATHQRGLDYGPTVFTYYYPLCDDDTSAARAKLLGTDRDHWADVVMTDLGRAHQGLDRLVNRIDIMRWGHAMIRPKPGFIWGPDRQAAARPFRGIHFAHSDLSGIALFEEAFHQGSRAAREVLDARGLESRV